MIAPRTPLNVAAAIPAYQAAPTVARVIEGTLRQLERVLVIDDGSTDDTARVAEQAGAEVERVPENRGKGHALCHAFGRLFAEGYTHVLTLDADGQHLPEEIPKLLTASQGADLVLGVRTHLFDEMSRLRQLSNQTSSRLISIIAGHPFEDTQTGFRLYSRRLIEATGFPEHRFEAESAVLVRAARCGFRVVSTPVLLAKTDGRGTSHYRPLLDSLRIARGVVRARWA